MAESLLSAISLFTIYDRIPLRLESPFEGSLREFPARGPVWISQRPRIAGGGREPASGGGLPSASADRRGSRPSSRGAMRPTAALRRAGIRSSALRSSRSGLAADNIALTNVVARAVGASP